MSITTDQLPDTDTDASRYGARIATLRAERGWSLEDLHYEVRRHLGKEETPGREQIRRYEIGLVSESTASLWGLIGIARAFNVSLGDISPLAVERYRRLAPLLRGKTSPVATKSEVARGDEGEGNLTLKVRPYRSLDVAQDAPFTTQRKVRKSLTGPVTPGTLDNGASPLDGWRLPTSWITGGHGKAVWPA